jgi:hypothetical protein
MIAKLFVKAEQMNFMHLLTRELEDKEGKNIFNDDPFEYINVTYIRIKVSNTICKVNLFLLDFELL